MSIIDALNLASDTNKKIMEDPEEKAKDRISASAAYLSAQYWLWRSEQVGSENIPQIKEFLSKNKKVLSHSTPTPVNGVTK